jgi:hypothetical protein
MWACVYCGQEYEKLYDARWNCPCRRAPDAIRFRRTRFLWGLYVLTTRTLLGVAIGLGLVLIAFQLSWFPGLFVPWGDGAGVGLIVGFVWGLYAWNGLPEPVYKKPGIIPRAVHLEIADDNLTVSLQDGRTITVPLSWYPRLLIGSEAQRLNWQLLGDGYAVEWPDLDEQIAIEGLLAGRRSGENQESFQRWLAQRDTARRSAR